MHGPPTRQVEQRPARICPALVLIPDPGGATHDAAAAAAVATRDGWWSRAVGWSGEVVLAARRAEGELEL